jgi:hypothetical protein
MNIRKFLMAILTIGILAGASCTTDNSDVYEQSVDRTKIRKNNHNSVDRTKIRKNNHQSVDRTKIRKNNHQKED